MRRQALISILVVAAVLAVAAPAGARGGSSRERDGLVFRYYAGLGYRFQPLLSFAELNRRVSQRRPVAARRLARALLAHGVRSGGAIYWEYDFPYGGGPVPWRSGFTQVVAAQALARAGALLDDASLLAAADASFRGLRSALLMRIGGGSWIREYGFTNEVILNAQLQSVISLESYAAIAKTPAARRLATQLEVAARTLLPRFDLGCWGRYQLGGGAADVHYQTYHVELLRQLASSHRERIWRSTYQRWKRCLR